jgi:hypothetical protein
MFNTTVILATRKGIYKLDLENGDLNIQPHSIVEGSYNVIKIASDERYIAAGGEGDFSLLDPAKLEPIWTH